MQERRHEPNLVKCQCGQVDCKGYVASDATALYIRDKQGNEACIYLQPEGMGQLIKLLVGRLTEFL